MSASSIADRAVAVPRHTSARTLTGDFLDPATNQRVAVHLEMQNEQPATPSPAKDALSSIATYIPSEGIALYIAIAAMGVAAHVDSWNWVALYAGLGANGLVLSLRFVQKSLEAKKTVDAPRLFYLLAVTGFLAAVDISAIPGNPWATMWPNSSLISGTLIVVLALIVPLLAPIIGLEATPPADES